MLDLPTQAAPMQYGWRCGHHQCHARVLPTTHHPIFKTGHGAQGLATQAATLFNATLGVLPKHTGLQFGISRNAVRGIYSNFYRFIESHVERGTHAHPTRREAISSTLAIRGPQKALVA